MTVIPAGSVSASNTWRDAQALFRKAGVPAYDKPFHSLRKSCITDWAGEFPTHVVKEWAGHADIRTTLKYYLKVSESEYDRAAGIAAINASTHPDGVQSQPVPDRSDAGREGTKSVPPGRGLGGRIREGPVELCGVMAGGRRFRVRGGPGTKTGTKPGFWAWFKIASWPIIRRTAAGVSAIRKSTTHDPPARPPSPGFGSRQHPCSSLIRNVRTGQQKL